MSCNDDTSFGIIDSKETDTLPFGDTLISWDYIADL